MKKIPSPQSTGCFMLISLISLLLTGCGSDDKSKTLQNSLSASKSQVYAKFDPISSVIPVPNDLLISPETGLLSIPTSTDSLSDPALAAQQLNGFSTIAPISTGFSGLIEASSVIAGDTIRIFNITNPRAPTPVSTSQYRVDVSNDAQESSLIISPTMPLSPSSRYLVIMTNGITDASGNNIQASGLYELLGSTTQTHANPSLNAVRQAINGYQQLATALGIDAASIVLSWSFTTQGIGQTLQAVYQAALASSAPSIQLTPLVRRGLSNSTQTTYAGLLSLPYYLQAPKESVTTPNESVTTPVAVLTGFWKNAGKSVNPNNPMPDTSSTIQIPVFASAPTSNKPANGYPVVIFQHGITSNRGVTYALAETFAEQGLGLLAIDLPLHGIGDHELDQATSSYGPLIPVLSALRLAGRNNERTFDLDLVNNTQTSVVQPDGKADQSGSQFINLQSLLTSRDNLRQGVSDLFHLVNAVSGMTDAQDEQPLFDPEQIHFVGMSLGGIVGATFLAHETRIKQAVLNVMGAGIAKLLDGSPSYGPRIAAGLAANGIDKGSSNYEQFLLLAQTAIDAADPINHLQPLRARNLLIQIVTNDSVVPNRVLPGYPNQPENTSPGFLSGSDPFNTLLGSTKLTSSTQEIEQPSRMLATLVSGNHGSLFSTSAEGNRPSAEAAEMLTQIISYIKSGGQSVQVGDSSLLQQ